MVTPGLRRLETGTFDFFDSFYGGTLSSLDWNTKGNGGGIIKVEDDVCKVLAPKAHAHDYAQFIVGMISHENSTFIGIFIFLFLTSLYMTFQRHLNISLKYIFLEEKDI